VQVAQRWILARLRKPTLLFVGGAERSHQNPRRRTQCPADEDFVASRAELFAELEKPRLTELPDQAYAFASWKRCRVGPDYHIKIDGHWYSAPYRLIRELVDARIDDRTVEIFHNGRRIASHARAPDRRGHTTIADHVSSVCDKTNASMIRATSLAC